VEEVRRGRAGGAERLLLEAHRCCGADPRAATCLTAPSPVGCPRRQDASFPSGLGRAEAPRMLPAAPAVPEGGGRRGSGTSIGALTVRERQVARLVADGSTNRQIGRALGIAEKTTEAHVHNIIRKLGAHNRAEVAARVSVPDEAD
jgi:DNA-binding CsgD family transcriptional regulator